MRAILGGLVLIAYAAGAAMAQTAPAFEDVPPWHWAFQSVQELAEKGILRKIWSILYWRTPHGF
jgi:hypothetical protein